MAIKIPIFADYDNKGVADAEGAFEAFGTKVGNIAKTAAVALAAIGAAAAAGAYKAIGAASDLEEAQSKVNVIFGKDGAKYIAQFAERAATEIGQSEQSVLDAVGTFGLFAKTAGLSGDGAAEFSMQFTELASDLASFNNTSPEEAINAIGSALRGESEPLRKYGVMLNDAALKAEAAAQGIYNGIGPLNDRQKILAAEALIYKKTSDAQGDFARTSDGLANKQRIFKAQLANIVVLIGQKLLPIFMKITDFISEKLAPVIELLTSAFEKDGLAGIIRIVQEQLPKLKEVLMNAVSAFADWLKEAYPPALRALLDMMYDLGQWLQNTGLPALAKLLGDGAEAFWNWIKEAAPPALRRLAELMGDLANWILDTGLPLLVDKLIVLGNALVDWIKPQIVPALKALGDLLLTLLNWVVTEAVPKLGAQAVKIGGALLGWIAQLLPEAVAGITRFVADLAVKIPGLFFSLIATMVNLGTRLGTDLIQALFEALKGLGSKGLAVGKAFAQGIIDFINANVIKKINDLLQFDISILGKTFTVNPPDIPPIPALAEGGIVTGPTLALIGEAGPEAVIPLSKMGGMGGGITVNVNGGISTSQEISQAIVKALQNYVYQSGPVPINTRAM